MGNGPVPGHHGAHGLIRWTATQAAATRASPTAEIPPAPLNTMNAAIANRMAAMRANMTTEYPETDGANGHRGRLLGALCWVLGMPLIMAAMVGMAYALHGLALLCKWF